MGQKRRRRTFACVACRRRKVKYDQNNPTCTRCQRRGVDCRYEYYTAINSFPTPLDQNPHPHREPSDSLWSEVTNLAHAEEGTASASTSHSRLIKSEKSIRELRESVSELRDLITKSVQPPPISLAWSLDRSTHLEETLHANHQALLRGNDFETTYFGASYSAIVLLQFEQLSAFVKTILQRLMHLTEVKHSWKQQRQQIKPPIAFPDHSALLSLIPEQITTDKLVQVYFEVIENTYRVLHAPTFYHEYKRFLFSPQEASAVFLVQLLLTCAISNLLTTDATSYVGCSSLQRDTSIKWVEICETWLNIQSQKHMTLKVFQVQVLIPIAKRLNSIKVKRNWTVAGHLLKLAMSTGLHREPSYLNKRMSVFDQEMRRRLWFTIVELEVQASMDRGMCASISPLDWDCLAPSNIHDEELDYNTTTMPAPRPITEYTRTSFLCSAQKHLTLRIAILSRMNRVRLQLDVDTVFELDQQLRQHMEDVPRWPEETAKVVVQPLLELLLYEYLLQIRLPIVAQMDAEAKHFLPRIARHEAAVGTARLYSELRPDIALLFTNLRDDLLRALLVLCYNAVVSIECHTQQIERWDNVVKLFVKGVDIMEKRVQQLGQGFYSFWLTACALGLLQSKVSSEILLEVYIDETTTRISRLHRHLTELQENHSVGDRSMDIAKTFIGSSERLPVNSGITEVDNFGLIGAQLDEVLDFGLLGGELDTLSEFLFGLA